jgi:hypothetical protein
MNIVVLKSPPFLFVVDSMYDAADGGGSFPARSVLHSKISSPGAQDISSSLLVRVAAIIH